MSENNKFQQAWLSFLGVFSSAEHRLMESLGLNPDNPLGPEILARMKKNREEFERRVDEGVKSAVAKVRAPLDNELAQLKARVEKIQQKIEEQKQKRKNKE
ncbi:MAG: hypothetical protein ACXVDD_23125 [Polyangia bacterium]